MAKTKFDDYEGFVEKFKPKKTTDDCYTPPEVYDVVLEHVRNTYGIDESVPIVRPFYPGGDYEHYDYPDGCLVVDNPPFSILAKILDFYQARGIRFFLFSPQLTSCCAVARRKGLTFVGCDTSIVYENGAVVNTGFVTNLSPELIFVTCPILRERIRAVNNRKDVKKVRKLEYDEHIFGTRDTQRLSLVDFAIKREDVRDLPRKDRPFGGDG